MGIKTNITHCLKVLVFVSQIFVFANFEPLDDALASIKKGISEISNQITRVDTNLKNLITKLNKQQTKPGPKDILILCDSETEAVKNFAQKIQAKFPNKTVEWYNATRFRYTGSGKITFEEHIQRIKTAYASVFAKGGHVIWFYYWTPGRFNALYGEEVDDDVFRNFPFDDKIFFVVNPDDQNIKDINERFIKGLLDYHPNYKTLSEKGRVFWTSNYKRGLLGKKTETWFNDLTQKIIEEDQ